MDPAIFQIGSIKNMKEYCLVGLYTNFHNFRQMCKFNTLWSPTIVAEGISNNSSRLCPPIVSLQAVETVLTFLMKDAKIVVIITTSVGIRNMGVFSNSPWVTRLISTKRLAKSDLVSRPMCIVILFHYDRYLRLVASLRWR